MTAWTVRAWTIRLLSAAVMFAVLLAGSTAFFDWLDRQPMRVLRSSPSGPIQDLVFSPDGRWLAVTQGEPTDDDSPDDAQRIRIWDMKAGALCATLVSSRHPRPMTFSPDSSFLAAQDKRDVIKVWDPATGKERLRIEPLSSPTMVRYRFSPDGSALLYFIMDPQGRLEIWDLDGVRKLASLKCLNEPRLSPDQSNMALWYYNETRSEPELRMQTWRLRSHQTPLLVRERNLPDWAAALSPDLKFCVGIEHTLKLWDNESGRQCAETDEFLAGPGLNGPRWPVFAPKGRLIFVPDGRVRWSPPEKIDVYEQHDQSLEHIGTIPSRYLFSPDGEEVFIHDYDSGMTLLDGLTLKERLICWKPGDKSLGGPVTDRPPEADFSPDGKLLAVNVGDPVDPHPIISWFAKSFPILTRPSTTVPVVRLWDLAQKREVAAYRNQLKPIFSPDSGTLATTADGAVYLWPMPPARRLALAVAVACAAWSAILVASSIFVMRQTKGDGHVYNWTPTHDFVVSSFINVPVPFSPAWTQVAGSLPILRFGHNGQQVWPDINYLTLCQRIAVH